MEETVPRRPEGRALWLVCSEPAGVIYATCSTLREAMRIAREQDELTIRHPRYVAGPYVLSPSARKRYP